VVYEYYRNAGDVALNGARGVIEYAPVAKKRGLNLWPDPGNDLPVMERVKKMFDPEGLLNRGRLYGRI
jgi:FAD/FMN-containing dehydrogenase